MRHVSLAFLALVLPGAALAQDVTVLQDGARYAMRSTADGTLRLDTRTGETTLCTTAGGKLRCEVSAEEREAYEREIDALGSRLEELEQRLIAIEAPEEGEASGDGVDKAVSMAERAMRGFSGVVKRLKRELEN